MNVRRHEYGVLAYCHQGGCEMQLGQGWRIEPGSLLLVPGWAAHEMSWTPGTQVSSLTYDENELPIPLREAVTSVRLGAGPLRCLEERAWNGDVEALLSLFVDQSRAAPEWVHNALRLVFEHCHQPWSLTRLADEVGISPAHLTTAVRRWTGKSLGQWSMQARLDYAGLQLSDRSVSVARVAEQCGFSDLAYFRRVFRRHFQHTPKEHRNR